MSIQTEINRINTEVSDQAALLDQAISALAGKAAGGGDGSGGSVETCTVTISSPNYIGNAVATVYKNGAFDVFQFVGVDEIITIENAVRGSVIVFKTSGFGGSQVSFTNATLLEQHVYIDDFNGEAVLAAVVD